MKIVLWLTFEERPGDRDQAMKKELDLPFAPQIGMVVRDSVSGEPRQIESVELDLAGEDGPIVYVVLRPQPLPPENFQRSVEGYEKAGWQKTQVMQ